MLPRLHAALQSAWSSHRSAHAERPDVQSSSQSARLSHSIEQFAPGAQVSLQSLESEHLMVQLPCEHVKRHVSLSLHSQTCPHSPFVAGVPVSTAPLS